MQPNKIDLEKKLIEETEKFLKNRQIKEAYMNIFEYQKYNIDITKALEIYRNHIKKHYGIK
ncbi:MAG: hypothetical protein ABIM64_04125 [candidate division WOR-3 bacterium]